MLLPSLSSVRFRVDRITKSVANKVDTNGTYTEDRCGEYPTPPILLNNNRVVCAVKHITPGRSRSKKPEATEAVKAVSKEGMSAEQIVKAALSKLK